MTSATELDSLHSALGEAERYAKELEARLAEREWRPIETAPRDGTWIWAFYPRKDRRQDEQTPARWHDCGPEPMWWDAAEHRDDEQPTHWMPLPEPPST